MMSDMTTQSAPEPTRPLPSLAGQSVDKPKQPVTARGERTRNALVAAARRVFERDGFQESRLTDITAEANCSTGTFYTYFQSKEEILDAVFSEAHEDMLHPGYPHLDDDADPITVLEASNRAYFEAYRRNARLRLVLEQVTANSPEFRKQRLMRGSAFSERNARQIARLQERGLADPDIDAKSAAEALSGMVSRMAYQAFALGSGADIDQLVATATRLWANAIGMRRPDGAG
mgnify:FL=1